MKCTVCKRNIAAGPDAQKMVVEYQQGDGTTKVFGYMMADGPLSSATGQLVRAWHHKHYHAARKREAKGVAAMPTSDPSKAQEIVAGLNAVAAEIGKPVGDPYVSEAYKAKLYGTPYPHRHQFRLETYQLLAHLTYAHGLTRHGGDVPPQDAHDELHAQAALAEAQRQRAHDPGHIEPPERDWRDQHVVDI